MTPGAGSGPLPSRAGDSQPTGGRLQPGQLGTWDLTVSTVANIGLGGAAVLAWVAGSLSVLATLMSGASSQARMLFDGGRSSLLPARLGRHPDDPTPPDPGR